MLKRALHYLTIGLVGLMVLGCATTSTTDTPAVPPNNPTPFPGYTFPLLDLTNNVIPLPNDLLRVNGKLAFPGTGEPVDAANSLTGFSTSGAIIIPFKGTIKASSVTNDTIELFNTFTGQKALMTFSVSANSTGSVVTAVPVHALDSLTRYTVVITNGVISDVSDSPVLSDSLINLLKSNDSFVDVNGNSTSPALDDATAAKLEPVRKQFETFWSDAERASGINKLNIPLAFSFTTQRLYHDLPIARSTVETSNAPLVNANPAFLGGNNAAEFLPVGMGHDVNAGGFTTTTPFNDETPGNGSNLDFVAGGSIPTVERFLEQNLKAGIPSSHIGRIHLGRVDVPIYRTDSLTGFWSDPLARVGTQTVNFVLFLPNSVQFPDILKGQGGIPTSAANQPVPVAIFQHGITGNKFQAAALADAFCQQGIAVIAIDLELHGDLSKPTPSNDSNVSGQGFINLENLRNSRDNIRQSVVNLYALTHAITSGQSNIDAPANVTGAAPELGAPAVNAAFPNPAYISLSLGSIVGDVFIATEPNISRAVLNVGGARITNLLLNSDTFGPIVTQGLAAKGIQAGTAQFAQFFLIAQAVVDDADPVNYADQATSGALRGGTPAQILQQANVTDAVVPPVAQYDMAIQHGAGNAAFSQIDAIVQQALLPQVSSPFTGIGVYEIPNAGHGSLLDPTAGPTAKILTQALTYLGTGQVVDTGLHARSTTDVLTDSAEDLARYAASIKI